MFSLPHTTGSAGNGMGISPDRGKPSPLKRKTLEIFYHHVLLNESKLNIPFIINPVRIRWKSGRLAFDLRVCQEMMRVLGSVRWLFYPTACTPWNCASRQKQGTWKRFLVFWGFLVVVFSWVSVWVFLKKKNGSFGLHSYQFTTSVGSLWVTKSTDSKQCRCCSQLEEMGSLESVQSTDAKWDNLVLTLLNP